MKKRIASLILAVLMLCAVIPFAALPAFAANEATDDGEILWEIEGDILRVWGHGNMKNFSDWDETPWYAAYDKVKHLEVGLKGIDGGPNGISRIGSYAFAYFYYLEDIKLGEGIDIIEDYAFYEAGYYSKTPKIELEIPSTVFYIGKGAFRGALGLKTVNIKSEISTFREFARKNTLPTVSGGNVTADGLYIRNEAFYACSNLESAAMKMGVKKIGEYAFSETGLKHICVPGTVKRIENYAFYNCPKLESAVIDDGVEEIGYAAFYYDVKLKEIWLSSTLKKAEHYAFCYCPIEKIYTSLSGFGGWWFKFGDYAFYGYNKNWEIYTTTYDPTVENNWTSDDFTHWKRDNCFHEAHVYYGEHTLGNDVIYAWDGDVCKAQKRCAVCWRDVTFEEKKGTYVSDIHNGCLAERGHYEVTFDTEGFAPQRTEACSVILDNGEHELTQLTGDFGLRYYYCDVCKNYFSDVEGKNRIDIQNLYDGIFIEEEGEYTVSESHEVSSLNCEGGTTLIIGKDAEVKVDGYFAVQEDATLIILGKLDLGDVDFSENFGSVKVACCGTLIMGGNRTGGREGWYNAPIKEGHDFDDGVCRVCGCAATGTIISDGALWIIIAVAVLAIGAVAALVVVNKKKKSAQAE